MALILPRLQRLNKVAEQDGRPTKQMQTDWNSFAKSIEDAFNQLESTLAATIAAQAAADSANAAAVAADAAATSAQGAADAVTTEQALINSYVTGLTLTAADAGADVTITISAHTRVYGDGTSLAVAGSTITAVPYSVQRYVYYVDATRADTTPSYLATASVSTAAQLGDTHLVGVVTTPAAAGPPSDGFSTRPPGVGTLLE